MSKFSNEVHAHATVALKPRLCKLGDYRHDMTLEDQEALDLAITYVDAQAKGFTIAWLVSVLNNNGYTIGKTVVSDHLARRCSCEQAGQ